MPKVIALPDGTSAEFPDSMDDAAIKGVLRKKFPPPGSLSEGARSYAVSEKPGMLEELAGGAKHAWDKAAASLQSAAGGLGLPTGESLQPLVEQGKQFVAETGPASTAGEILGEIGMTAVPGASAFKAASTIPRLSKAAQRFAGGAAAGGTGAAMMGGDVADVGTSGVVGGVAENVLPPVLKGAVKASKAVSRGARDVVQGPAAQASRYLQGLFGERTPMLVNELRDVRGTMPGEVPTAGYVATQGFPEVKVMENRARNSPTGYKFATVDDANLAARQSPLEVMAEPGIPRYDVDEGAMLSEAKQLRKNATDPLYARANPDRIALTPELEGVIAGPEAVGALRSGQDSFIQAQRNAAGRGTEPPAGRTPAQRPAGEMPPEYASESMSFGQPYRASEPFMPQLATRSINELQRIKSDLTLRINSPMIDPLEKAQLIEARKQLTRAMTEQSGNYAVANTVFKNMSSPQNQADVAKVLLDALKTPVGERPSTFLRAMENAPQTFKRADQSPRFEHLRQIMSPEQMTTLNTLRKSVQREADYDALKVGEGMVPQAKSVAERVEAALPPIFSQGMTTLRKFLSRAGTESDAKIRQIINDALLDPNKLADLLTKVPANQRGKISEMLQHPKLQEFMASPYTHGAAIGYTAGQSQE
jgi:hypothetical protein